MKFFKKTGVILAASLFTLTACQSLEQTAVSPINTPHILNSAKPIYLQPSKKSESFTTLSLSCNSQVFAEAYNIDDSGYISVNNFSHTFGYGEALQRVDITPHLNDGLNEISFSLVNDRLGYAYGFRLIQDGEVLYEASKLANGWGGTETRIYGTVYVHTEAYEFCSPSPTPTPTATPTQYPTPGPSVTPTPLPSIFPQGSDKVCQPPSLVNDFRRLQDELERLNQNLSDPVILESASGFSVQFGPAIPLIISGVELATFLRNTALVLGAAEIAWQAGKIAGQEKQDKVQELTQQKDAIDQDFADAVADPTLKGKERASRLKDLRDQSKQAQVDLIKAQQASQLAQQALNSAKQNRDKIADLNQEMDALQLQIQENCEDANPSPSPIPFPPVPQPTNIRENSPNKHRSDLRKALEENDERCISKDDDETLNPNGYDKEDAHHIIPLGRENLGIDRVHEIMAACDGIDIDDADNGVCLDKATHKQTYPFSPRRDDAYYQEIIRIFENTLNVDGTVDCDKFKNNLEVIKNHLKAQNSISQNGGTPNVSLKGLGL